MSPDCERMWLAFQYAEARATGELSSSESAMAWSQSSVASMVRPAVNRAAAKVTASRMPSSLATTSTGQPVERGLGGGDGPVELALLAPDPAQGGRGLEPGHRVGPALQHQLEGGRGAGGTEAVEGRGLDVARPHRPTGDGVEPRRAEGLTRPNQRLLGLAAHEGKLRVVEQQLETLGVLPAVPEHQELHRDAEPGGKSVEQLDARPPLSALDPGQEPGRGVRTGQLGLGQTSRDTCRLDTGAQHRGVECGELVGELGRHGHILPDFPTFWATTPFWGRVGRVWRDWLGLTHAAGTSRRADARSPHEEQVRSPDGCRPGCRAERARPEPGTCRREGHQPPLCPRRRANMLLNH